MDGYSIMMSSILASDLQTHASSNPLHETLRQAFDYCEASPRYGDSLVTGNLIHASGRTPVLVLVEETKIKQWS